MASPALKLYKSTAPHPRSAHSAPPCHQTHQVVRWEYGERGYSDDEVAQEIAVALIYNGISHAVMMASPNDLEEFALGFSLSEGILRHSNELYDLVLNPHDEGLEISMTIASQRIAELKQRRRNLTGRTGCGLCGAESLQQAIRPAAKVPFTEPTGHQAIQRAVKQLNQQQPLQALTGAFHGAAWCDRQGHILILREDVGRHNALDKLIGALSRAEGDPRNGFALTTSRASYEMVQKASMAGIPMLVAMSAPTTLAIRLAQKSGLTLVGFARSGRHTIYTQPSDCDLKTTTTGEKDTHE